MPSARFRVNVDAVGIQGVNLMRTDTGGLSATPSNNSSKTGFGIVEMEGPFTVARSLAVKLSYS